MKCLICCIFFLLVLPIVNAAPVWQNQGTNDTDNLVPQNGAISLNAQANDAVGLDWAWLSTNETGSWQNYSLNSGMVGYWKFDYVNASNYTLDYSGYKNDGKLFNFSTNPPTTVAGIFGNALQFDGVNNYINTTNSSIFSSTSKTILAWVKLNSLGTNQLIAGKTFENWITYNGVTWNCSSNKFGFAVNGTPYSCVNSTTQPVVGQWYFVAGVYNGSHMSIYVNGVLEGGPVVRGVPTPSKYPFDIGGYSKYATFLFNGMIDEVEIWNKALTGDEISREYSLGHYKEPVNMNGISNIFTWSNFTWKNPSAFGIIAWRIYYNNTVGQETATDVMIFNVTKRSNLIVLPDISEVSRSPGESQIFNISVTNTDFQSGSQIFKLISDCPENWNCTIDPKNLSISAGASNYSSLNIKSSNFSTGKFVINLTAVSLSDSSFNASIGVGFIIDTRCTEASMKISDVYFYGNNVEVVVENNGAVNLTINSAVITDIQNQIFNANGIPISGFNVGDKKNVTFTNVSSCGNFSKITITTDCSKAYVVSNQSKCLGVKSNAMIKIDSVEYQNKTVKAVLRNTGSGSIDSSSIKILINGKAVECKKSFSLSPKNITSCEISFTCNNKTAKFEISEPNKESKEFECQKPIEIKINSCINSACSETSTIFYKGDSVYIKIDVDPSVNIKADLVYDGVSREIDITDPIKLKNEGTYTIKVTASKEGYLETIKEIDITAQPKSGNTMIIIIVVGVMVLCVGGFVIWKIKKNREKKAFAKLYQKYGGKRN